MSKNAMAGAVTLCGVGLCMIGGALLMQNGSDGTVEIKKIEQFSTSPSSACGSAGLCASPWIVISSPTQGYRAAADINADQIVDGVDLASVLGNWGDAPRVPFPPSDCPLNLVNP